MNVKQDVPIKNEQAEYGAGLKNQWHTFDLAIQGETMGIIQAWSKPLKRKKERKRGAVVLVMKEKQFCKIWRNKTIIMSKTGKMFEAAIPAQAGHTE